MKLGKCARCEHKFDIRAHKECPECGEPYLDHKKLKDERPLGYPQCEWQAGGERCRYPGSVSSNGKAWFCRGHYACSDPVTGAAIVEQSRAYKHVSPSDTTAATKKAAEFCFKNGLHTVDDMRAWVRKRVGSIGRGRVRQPGEDEEETA